MLVVSSREFRDNQAQYFDLADSRKDVVILRGKNKAYRLLPISEDDYVAPIPAKYLCNPFNISPSGDMFWADKRNVEKLEKAIEQWEKDKDKEEEKHTVISTEEDLHQFFDNL